jgi:hypothetical protein
MLIKKINKIMTLQRFEPKQIAWQYNEEIVYEANMIPEIGPWVNSPGEMVIKDVFQTQIL